MNNRTLRARVGAVLLVLALCLTVLPAAAASGSMQTVYLDSAEEFAAFAKSCSLDTWSQGKTFILRADISLSGVDFTPAASFGGTFEGRGHTISDFNLTQNASPAGLAFWVRLKSEMVCPRPSNVPPKEAAGVKSTPESEISARRMKVFPCDQVSSEQLFANAANSSAESR